MKFNEIIKKSIDIEEKNVNLNPYEYDKVWSKIDCEIDKRESTIGERIRKIKNIFKGSLKVPFNYKDIIQIGLFLAIVVGIPLSIYQYNKAYKNDIYADAILEQKNAKAKDTIKEINNNALLTVEEIKKNYKEILSLEEFNDHYVLVQYKREYDGTSFDLYNLITGNKDVVTTNGFSKLVRIISENEFLFLESGKAFDSSYWTAPYYIRCTRVKQVANTEGSFKAVVEPAFFNIDESIVFGDKSADMISQVESIEDSLSVTFSPVPGKETMFFAAYSNVPVTNTSYIKDKNQLVLDFKDCEVDEKLINVKHDIIDNEYISGYKIIKGSKDSKLIIDLKSTSKSYKCSIEDVSNGLVILDIKFMNKEEESSSLDQNKSLEGLLKCYDYDIFVNIGYNF